MTLPWQSTTNYFWGICGVLFVFYWGVRTGESVWEGRGHFMPKQLPSSSTALPISSADEGEREVSGKTNMPVLKLSIFQTSAFRRPPVVHTTYLTRCHLKIPHEFPSKTQHTLTSSVCVCCSCKIFIEGVTWSHCNKYIGRMIQAK